MIASQVKSKSKL